MSDEKITYGTQGGDFGVKMAYLKGSLGESHETVKDYRRKIEIDDVYPNKNEDWL